MESAIEGEDRISDLPLFVLHRILNLVPRAQAARTCLLCKRFCSVWNLFPYLTFRLEDVARFDEFQHRVENSLHKFLDNQLMIKRFNLLCYVFDRDAHSSFVDRWLESALDNGVSAISLVATTITTAGVDLAKDDYSLPETLFIPRSVTDYSKLHFLEVLKLEDVGLSDSIIRDLNRNCPNLRVISLWKISGLKHLAISGLDKLQSIDVGVRSGLHELESILIDAPNLNEFVYHSQENLPCTVNLTSCGNLRVLHLSSCAINDDVFNRSSFPRLETLDLNNCFVLQRFKLSAHRLNNIRITRCKKIETIEIDAPNVSSYYIATFAFPVRFSENVSCPIKVSYLFDSIDYSELASSWFLKLRKFILSSKEIKVFRLDRFSKERVSFNLKEFEEEDTHPKVELEHLKLDSWYGFNIDYASLVNGLLWSCHPKRISVKCDSYGRKNCLRALCQKLLNNNPRWCCVDSHVDCWHHDFKSAKIDKYGEIKDGDDRLLDWKQLLHTFPNSGSVSFTLVWDL